MNHTARLALERAAARQSGQKHAALAPRPTPAAMPAPVTSAPQRAVTELPPRIDRVLFIEGQRAAKDLLASMVGILTSRESAAGVLIRLRCIADANPHSYAAGVLNVVAAVEQLLPPTTEQIDFTEMTGNAN